MLGQARSLQASHGGQAKHDQSDLQHIAALLRGGMRPQASVDPAQRRATGDLWRRRPHLRRNRAERLAPVPKTTSHDNLPALGKKLADPANRAGVAPRFAAPAVHKRIDGDLARSSLPAAQHHDAHTRYLRQPVPGLGQLRSLVRLAAIHDMARFPSGPDGVSECRLVQGAKASASTRSGTSGHKLGPAHLTWACSEAAGLGLRNKPAGPKSMARGATQHATGQAWTLLAHQLARAVYAMRKPQSAFRWTSASMARGAVRVRRPPNGPRRDQPGMRGLCPVGRHP